MKDLPTPVLAICLSYGAFDRVHAPDKSCLQAIEYMVKNPDTCATWLIERFGKNSAMERAVRMNKRVAPNPKVLKTLIDRGCDVHAGDDKPLMMAASLGRTSMLRELLRVGADVCANGGKMLAIAASKGHLDAVRELLKAGAPKIDLALMHAVRNGHVAVVSALVLEADGIALKNNPFALADAAYFGYAEVASVLLKAGANVHTRAYNDDALVEAARGGHVDVMRVLLDARANTNTLNELALSNAAYHGHTQIVRMLLEAGADARTHGGKALVSASFGGHVDVIRALIEAGADVHTEDNSALKIAMHYGHAAVVRMLRKAGSRVPADGKGLMRALLAAGCLLMAPVCMRVVTKRHR